MGKSHRRELFSRKSSDEESDGEDYIPGRPPKLITGAEHAEKYGDKRVSMLDVLKKVRPRSPVTKALEEKAARDEGDEDEEEDDAEMEPLTEADYDHIRDTAISKTLPPAERRHKAQVASRAERAARRAERDGTAPAAGGTRRSTRRQTEISYAESSPSAPSPATSSPLFVSPKSESYSPSPRGVKRKRTTKDKDEEVKPGAKRNTKRILEDEDEEMEDAASRSRSVTPAPPIKKHSRRVTALVDSDDEMEEASVSQVSASRSRSATPAPPVKKRKVEGKRVTILADSDDEME